MNEQKTSKLAAWLGFVMVLIGVAVIGLGFVIDHQLPVGVGVIMVLVAFHVVAPRDDRVLFDE